MKFREAKHQDLTQIVAMIADYQVGTQRENYRSPLPQSYHDAFSEISEDENQQLMVVLNDHDEIIGTFQISFLRFLTYQGGLRAQVKAVRVKKVSRGTGIGRKIFEWAIHRAKEKGAHVLQLTTDKKRLEAVAFYKSLGFVDTHEGMKLHL